MGGEINFLIEKGIIRLTETGAIHAEDLHKDSRRRIIKKKHKSNY